MRTNTVVLGVLVGTLAAGLVACEPGGESTAAAEGRTRLSSTRSYAEFGRYVIHVNALTTTSLAPEVAENYGIVRSENRGLVNLVILEKSADMGTDKPVSGEVAVSAANLTGQLKTTELREIMDGSSVYYIAEVSIDDRETINFDFDVRPAGSDRNLLVRFSHSFYSQ